MKVDKVNYMGVNGIIGSVEDMNSQLVIPRKGDQVIRTVLGKDGKTKHKVTNVVTKVVYNLDDNEVDIHLEYLSKFDGY